MNATRGEIDLYTGGRCHVFAVAMHRMLGATLLVVTDPTDPAWTDEADPDNQIDGVVHVFAVVGDMAHDVEVSVPVDEVEAYCRERFGTFMPMTDEVGDEAGLQMYVEGQPGDDEEGIDRPLSPYGDREVHEAEAVVARVHASLAAPTP